MSSQHEQETRPQTGASAASGGCAALPRRSRVSSAAMLASDAALFVVLAYKGVEYALLGIDGVVSRPLGAAVFLGAIAVLMGHFYVTHGRLGAISRETWIDQLLGIAAILSGPALLVLSRVTKGYTNVWIPLEWHKIALNLLLMARIAPGGLVATLAVTALLALALARRSRGMAALACAVLLGWAGLSGWFIVFELGSSKMKAYVIAFVVPLVIGAIAIPLGYLRWAMRATFATALSSQILWIYVGFLPWGSAAHPKVDDPAITHVYPRPGAAPDFDLQYMREFVLSHDRRFLFTCYGPSSGLVRVDLATHEARVLEFPGLARYLWSNPARDEILSMDWDKGNFLVFEGDPLRIVRQVNVLEQGRIAPWSFAVTPERIFITFHELPILAEYERDTQAFVRQLSMRDLGLTRFRSGLLKVLHDPTTGHLYAELGMTDRHDRFLLLEVDPATLTVVDKQVLPEGGLDFITIPGKRTLVAASFFSDRFYEYSLAPLRPLRSFRGPLNSRNLLFDPKRELFYALAFLPGELWAFEYGDPTRIVKRIPIGKKAQSLMLDPVDDVLWAGSQEGIFRVDLASWLGERGR